MLEIQRAKISKVDLQSILGERHGKEPITAKFDFQRFFLVAGFNGGVAAPHRSRNSCQRTVC
jgi:hypothetical protein